MKRILTFILSILPLAAEAQEMITPAIITDGDTRNKTLLKSGLRVPGGIGVMTPENKGTELGAYTDSKKEFLLSEVQLQILENQIEGCMASIMIYSAADDSFVKIHEFALSDPIPLTKEKVRLTILPEEPVVLPAGKYLICFHMRDCAVQSTENRLTFPLFLKESYKRKSPDSKPEKCAVNIGLNVAGKIYR